LAEAFGILSGGLVLLVLGAEGVVRGAARIGERLGVSKLFIGLTIVAFGTSSPEVVIGIEAALRGYPSLGVGNVVGSNIFNIGIVLGVTAIISPIPVRGTIVQREVPIVIGLTAVLFAIAQAGFVTRIEAALLLSGLVGYTVWSYRVARQESTAGGPGELSLADTLSMTLPSIPGNRALRPSVVGWVRDWILVLAGLALLVFGSHLAVSGAEGLARLADVSDALIGLSVVAIGTSLPELVTSVVAAVRKEPELAIGNVLGSNIFNILMILGVAGAVHPLAVDPRLVRIDIPVALGFALACFPILLSSHRISRTEGVTLVALYVAYLAFLVR
jgi:cation:H+ antiporter